MVFLDNRQTGRCNAGDNSVPEPRSIKNPGEQVAQELFATFSGILTVIGDLFLTAQALSLQRVSESLSNGRRFKSFRVQQFFLDHSGFSAGKTRFHSLAGVGGMRR
jgi:hypothetical protein